MSEKNYEYVDIYNAAVWLRLFFEDQHAISLTFPENCRSYREAVESLQWMNEMEATLGEKGFTEAIKEARKEFDELVGKGSADELSNLIGMDCINGLLSPVGSPEKAE